MFLPVLIIMLLPLPACPAIRALACCRDRSSDTGGRAAPWFEVIGETSSLSHRMHAIAAGTVHEGGFGNEPH
jgi:hypothetical protein